MPSRLANRISELERLNTDSTWLIVSVDKIPSSKEIDAMEAAHAAGRFVILFISDGDSAWCYSSDQPKPWDILH